MASWMVHLQVADAMLDRLKGIADTEFIVGNIAPDSGVPSQDWSYYMPSSRVSHFKTGKIDTPLGVDIDTFIEQYFTGKMQETYTKEQYSFYLGYLTHLLTDIEWSEKIAEPCKRQFGTLWETEKEDCIRKMKRDWYDLDFKYIQAHPDFRAFQIYKNAVNFENEYMDIFAKDAFDNRREYIIQFYLSEKNDLEHEYCYLTEATAHQFVVETVETVEGELERYSNSFATSVLSPYG